MIGHPGRTTILACLLMACACGGDPAPSPDHTPVRLVPVARSAPLPYSRSNSFAVDDSVACIVDTYRVTLVCGDRRWEEPSVVAREGRGPGEIGPYGDLLTWADGSVAYHDTGSGRLSFFSSGLRFDGSVRVPRGHAGMSRTVDSTLAVHGWPSPAGPPQLLVRTLDVTTGGEVGRVLLTVDPAGLRRDSVVMNGGVSTPDGGYLMRLTAPGWDGLAWFGADGSLVGRTELPDYGPVYPSDRDVEEVTEGNRRLFGQDPTPGELRRFLETPLRFFPRGSAPDLMQFDPAGRLWTRSTRPSGIGSYLEVFEDGVHSAAIEVPGRVVSFQIVDSLLTALVEATEPDSVGIHPRRLDWYRIEAGGPD